MKTEKEIKAMIRKEMEKKKNKVERENVANQILALQWVILK